MRSCIDLADDGPDEADEFPGHGCGHLAWRLAHSAETAVTAAESLLGLPGDGLHPVRRGGGLGLQMACLAGGDARVPRRFHQDPPDMAVAGLRDLPGDARPTRAGLITEAEHEPIRAQALDQVPEGGSVVGNRPLPRGLGPTRSGDGHRNRILVDVKAHISTVFIF